MDIQKDVLWEAWLIRMKEKHFPKKNRWEIRTYKHFTRPFRKMSEVIAVKDDFLVPEKVAKHDFMPLLAFLKKTPIFSRDNGLERKDWKVRPLMYADHPDAWLYSWYSYLLGTYYEKALEEAWLENVVSAYRRNDDKINNAMVAKELFDFITERNPSESWEVLLFDVEKFYDTLHPRLLKSAWAKTIGARSLPIDHFAIYKSIVEYGVVRKGDLQRFLNDKFGPLGTKRQRSKSQICNDWEFHKVRKQPWLIMSKGKFLKEISKFFDATDPDKFQRLTDKPEGSTFYKWVPQWLPISPTLANVYMLGFDRLLNDEIHQIGGFLRRYADDIAVVCPSSEADRIEAFILKTISDPSVAWLNIQKKKTERYRISDGKVVPVTNTEGKQPKPSITYLWLTYQNGKWYVKSGTIAKWHQRLRKLVRKNYYRGKYWAKVYTESQLYQKALWSGLLKYIRSVAETHDGWHVEKQFSKNRVRKALAKLLKSSEKTELSKEG